MTDQSGSDPMSGKENRTDDEDIIELTDEILPEDEEEDLIELTDEILPEDEEEDLIELTDEIPSDTVDDDEAIIELTEELTDEAVETRDEGEELDLDLDFDDDGGMLGRTEEIAEDQELEFDLGGEKETEGLLQSDAQEVDEDLEFEVTADTSPVELPEEKEEEILELTEEIGDEAEEVWDEGEELDIDLDFGGEDEEFPSQAEDQELEFDLEGDKEAETLFQDMDKELEFETTVAGENEDAGVEVAEAREEGEIEFDLDSGDDEEGVLDLTETVTEETDEDPELEFDLEADTAEADDAILELAEDAAEDREDGEIVLDLDFGDEGGEILDLTEEDTEAQYREQALEFDLGTDEAGETPVDVEPDTAEAEAEVLDTAVPDEDMPRKDVELASAMGIELDPGRDLSRASADSDVEGEATGQEETATERVPALDIPRESLEAAIERVIESKLSEKIDGLLNSAIEKAVTAEISRLKRLLTDNLSKE